MCLKNVLKVMPYNEVYVFDLSKICPTRVSSLLPHMSTLRELACLELAL